MLSLGIDTGGTYTDAVLTDESGNVLASAKALTSHEHLIVGIREALDAVLAGHGEAVDPVKIAMVCLSTTLATNAIVEGNTGSAGLVIVGSDDALATRGGLAEALSGEPWIRLPGGHDASGAEKQPLDLTPLDAWLGDNQTRCAAFAICAEFGVMNSAHELAVREWLVSRTGAPTTCAHELSARLNAPRRALTALLNARLLPRITALMDAVQAALAERHIPGRLMVVKGDGSLVGVDMARERPVETILSGPAASVVGAAHLSAHRDVLVADIGGTTTDIAILRNGRPRLDPMGASVGGFRTLVTAAAVHSVGLGGDSTVWVSGDGKLHLSPRRIVPLCRLAQSHSHIVAELKRAQDARVLTINDLKFVWRAPNLSATAPRIRRDEHALWQQLDDTPQRASALAPDRYTATLLERLTQRGLVAMSGLTPTDAAHALGLHDIWNALASNAALGGWLRLAEFNKSGLSDLGNNAKHALAERVLDCFATQLALALLDAAYDAAPPAEVDKQSWQAARGLLEHALAHRDDDDGTVFRLTPSLTLPVVAVGASAGCHFPRVRDRLGFELDVPEQAGVTNALGAVVGAVHQRAERRITSPESGVFRLNGEQSQQDFLDLDSAIAAGEEQARSAAVSLALRAGAADCEVDITVERVVAELAGGESLFVEATICATAQGRPARTT